MDSEKAKPILIGVAVVFLLASGVMLYRNMGGGGARVDRRAVLEAPIPMFCTACGHGFEMPNRDYRELMDVDPGPLYDCPSCSQKAVAFGFKCNHCSVIFPVDNQRNPQFRCPGCGRNNTTE